MPGNKVTQRPRVASPTESPFTREMGLMRNRIRHLLNEPLAKVFHEPFVNDDLTQPLGWSPVVEASETADAFLVTAEVPGLKAEDISVECENGVLTIRGSKQEECETNEPDRRYHLWERSYGAFQRSFTFPGAVVSDKIVAELDGGVLTVRVPKSAEAKSRAKRIAITQKV